MIVIFVESILAVRLWDLQAVLDEIFISELRQSLDLLQYFQRGKRYCTPNLQMDIFLTLLFTWDSFGSLFALPFLIGMWESLVQLKVGIFSWSLDNLMHGELLGGGSAAVAKVHVFSHWLQIRALVADFGVITYGLAAAFTLLIGQ